MKRQNLAIQHQQLENNKNFYYNIVMKNKEEIRQIALRIYQLEKIHQKLESEGKCVQSVQAEIQNIIEGLSLQEFFELNELVTEAFKN